MASYRIPLNRKDLWETHTIFLTNATAKSCMDVVVARLMDDGFDIERNGVIATDVNEYYRENVLNVYWHRFVREALSEIITAGFVLFHKRHVKVWAGPQFRERVWVWVPEVINSERVDITRIDNPQNFDSEWEVRLRSGVILSPSRYRMVVIYAPDVHGNITSPLTRVTRTERLVDDLIENTMDADALASHPYVMVGTKESNAANEMSILSQALHPQHATPGLSQSEQERLQETEHMLRGTMSVLDKLVNQKQAGVESEKDGTGMELFSIKGRQKLESERMSRQTRSLIRPHRKRFRDEMPIPPNSTVFQTTAPPTRGDLLPLMTYADRLVATVLGFNTEGFLPNTTTSDGHFYKTWLPMTVRGYTRQIQLILNEASDFIYNGKRTISPEHENGTSRSQITDRKNRNNNKALSKTTQTQLPFYERVVIKSGILQSHFEDMIKLDLISRDGIGELAPKILGLPKEYVQAPIEAQEKILLFRHHLAMQQEKLRNNEKQKTTSNEKQAISFETDNASNPTTTHRRQNTTINENKKEKTDTKRNNTNNIDDDADVDTKSTNKRLRKET